MLVLKDNIWFTRLYFTTPSICHFWRQCIITHLNNSCVPLNQNVHKLFALKNIHASISFGFSSLNLEIKAEMWVFKQQEILFLQNLILKPLKIPCSQSEAIGFKGTYDERTNLNRLFSINRRWWGPLHSA